MLKKLRKSLRSLFMHRLRALLSTLGILFGVVSVIAMLSIGEGAKQETLEQIEQLGMHNIMIRQQALTDEQRQQVRDNLSQGLRERDVEALKNGVPHLVHQAPIKLIEAAITPSPQAVIPEILAVTREFAEIKSLPLVEGRFICDLDNRNQQLVCVLGYEIARQLGRAGHVGQDLCIGNISYQIVGVLKSTHWKESKTPIMMARDLNKVIFIPLGAERILPNQSFKNEHLSEIILQLHSGQNMSMAVAIIKHILSLSHSKQEDYQIIVPKELLDQASRTQTIFNLVLGGIAALSLLVGGIGIMNIMLATVSERTREIGIRRAVGANQRHIIVQFLSETLILTLTGAILGIVIGVLTSWGISYFAGWKTIVTLYSIFLSLLMATGVGLCSGLYPAIKAARMDPIAALRYI
jgi:putative ABC transport system permease protein